MLLYQITRSQADARIADCTASQSQRTI